VADNARLAVLEQVRAPIKRLPPWQFERASASERLARHFAVQDLAGFGAQDLGPAIGAQLAHAGTEDIANVQSYGRSIGLAFQVIDDILDIVSTCNKGCQGRYGRGGAHASGWLASRYT
jgi:DNA mismatch repair protein MutS